MKDFVKRYFQILLIVLLLFVPFVQFAKLKADAFNRLTGHHITTSDAFFLNLGIYDTISPREIPQIDPDPISKPNSSTRLRDR